MVTKVDWFKTSKILGLRIVTSTTTTIINLDYCISYVVDSKNIISLTLTNGTVQKIDFGDSDTNKDVYDKLITFLGIC